MGRAACLISSRSGRLVPMKIIAIVLLGTAFAFSAGDPQGFYFWKSGDLKAFTKTLPAKMDAKKFANQRLGDDGNHYYLMVHREGTADAELHETQADVIVVQTGEGTLVYGGEVVEMPAKVPHWVKVAPGKQITYLVIKVTQ